MATVFSVSDMAFDILKKARTPLHVSDILDRIHTQFGLTVDRESLVSSLTKKVARKDVLSPAGGSMSLLAAFLAIVQDWRNVFPQQRTFQRGVRQALGSLVCLGRRCLTRIIWTNGGQDRSWSAEYFLHSRCQWSRKGCSVRS
ncbi:MAG: hypothetical protein JNN08_24820 [Bryobacterales bacterium]|nr:hypothetical protein [Bryobacterales bacterium]